MSQPDPTRRVSRFRFGLRSLIATLTAVAILFAFAARPFMMERRQKRIINRIVQLGGSVDWSEQAGDEIPRFVSLAGTKVTDGDLAEIMQLRHIKDLDLRGTRITDKGMEEFRGSNWLINLNIRDTAVTDKGLLSLTNCKNLGYVDAFNTQVTYDGLDALDAKGSHDVHAEIFAVHALKAAGVGVVCSPNAVSVDLNGHEVIAEHGVIARFVSVDSINVTRDMVEQLSRLDSLKTLRMRDVTIEPGCLASLKGLPNLRGLEISIANLEDADLKYLARLKSVENLELVENLRLTGESLNELSKLPNLKRIKIWECRGVSGEKLKGFADKIPNCETEFSRTWR